MTIRALTPPANQPHTLLVPFPFTHTPRPIFLHIFTGPDLLLLRPQPRPYTFLCLQISLLSRPLHVTTSSATPTVYAILFNHHAPLHILTSPPTPSPASIYLPRLLVMLYSPFVHTVHLCCLFVLCIISSFSPTPVPHSHVSCHAPFCLSPSLLPRPLLSFILTSQLYP